jgi:hypothetical protein
MQGYRTLIVAGVLFVAPALADGASTSMPT